MNVIVNKCLLSGDKFMHLRQPGLNCRACGLFTKHCERILKFKEAGDLNYICKNELEKISFSHDALYADSKDLAKRTVLDKILKD